MKHKCRAKRVEREKMEKEERKEEERERMEKEERKKIKKEKRKEEVVGKTNWTDAETEVIKMEDVCEIMKADKSFEKEETNEQMMKVDKELESSDNASDDCGFAENESGYASDKEINEEDDDDDLISDENLQLEKLKKNLEEFCYSSVFCLGYDE